MICLLFYTLKSAFMEQNFLFFIAVVSWSCNVNGAREPGTSDPVSIMGIMGIEWSIKICETRKARRQKSF